MGFYNIVNAPSLQAGQPEDISQVLANLQAIAAVLNGGVDNSNISGIAAIARPKLDFGVGLVDADIAAAAALAVTKLAAGGAGAVLGANQAPANAWVRGVQEIYDSVLGASAANFDIQNIPATFKHLLLVGYLRGDTNAALVGVNVRMNNDSAANYDGVSNDLFSSANTPSGTIAQAAATVGRVPALTAPAGAFGALEMEVPHYAGAVGHKPMMFRSVSREGAIANTLNHRTGAAIWFAAAAAINRITVFPGAGNWITGSRLTLYGIG